MAERILERFPVKGSDAVQLLVMNPWITAYRVPFYDRLDVRLSEHDVELVVAHGIASPRFAARRDMGTGTWAREVPMSWWRLGRREIARRRIGPTLKELTPDLIVVEQTLHGLETVRLLAEHSVGRYGLAMWGQGRSYSSPQSTAEAAVKQWLTRRCDWFFAYTGKGADHVVRHGFPRARVSVLNNTIDTDQLRADLDAVDTLEAESFRRRLGLTSGRTALFLGGIDDDKGIGFLLDSARIAGDRMPGFVLLIAGEGDSMPAARAAEASGAPVRVLGRVDGQAKATALSVADVVAIPERVGLVVIDALVAGRPIITTDFEFHGPEYGYLVPGQTSVVARHTSVDYGAALVSTLEATDRLAAMQEATTAESRRYNLDSMVDSFVEGVLAWRDLRWAGLTKRTRSARRMVDLGSATPRKPRKLAVLMTCHNRREQTVRCLEALRANHVSDVEVRVYVTDDGSTDGTASAITDIDMPMTVIAGSGDLYWAAGMAIAERTAMRDEPDLLLWLNDDVTLESDGLARLLAVHEGAPGAIVVGSVRDPNTGAATYGGRVLKGRHPQRFSIVPASDRIQRVDAFNGNVLLIPRCVRDAVGPVDGVFAHAYADDDYSLRALRLHVLVVAAPGTVGICSPNLTRLTSTSLRDAWKELQSPKGRPWRSQIRYLRRHGGLEWPLYLAWGYGKALIKASWRADGSNQ